MNEPTCETCPWWSRFPERVEYGSTPQPDGSQLEIRAPNERGECRKLPPHYERVFPISNLDDWCAEHPARRLPPTG